MNEDAEIVQEFLVESHENLDQLDRDLVELEQSPGSRELLSSIFRAIHTIKGTSGFLAFHRLETLTHVGENLLSRLRDGELTMTESTTQVLLQMVDTVRALLDLVEQTETDQGDEVDVEPVVEAIVAVLEGDDDIPGVTEHQAEPEPVAEPVLETAPEPVAAPVLQTVPEPVLETAPEPVAATVADDTREEVLMEDDDLEATTGPLGEHEGPRLGEVLVTKGVASPDAVGAAIAEQLRGDERPLGELLLDQGEVSVGQLEEALVDQRIRALDDVDGGEPSSRRSVVDSSVRVDVELLDSLVQLVGELVLTRNQIMQKVESVADVDLTRATQRLNLVASELQEGVMKTRMQPIGQVWAKMPRIVRDLAHQLGRKVDLQMDGHDTELDRSLLEALKGPLTHLVRNALDHGLETPEQRLAAGKPAEGRLVLRAYHESGQVVVEITDDGRGINIDRVGAIAVERGVVTADRLRLMETREIQSLIFRPGFSTAAEVTNVSGRGVGMDVVRTNIERIGGSVDLNSQQGRGTTVRVRIPLTLAIIPALLVGEGPEVYAIPQANLVELVRLEGEDRARSVQTLAGAPVLRLRGHLLPLVSLSGALGVDAAESESLTIVVLQADDVRFGLTVQEVHDTQEIVVKPIGRQMKGLGMYAGATIMGDGRVSLILDVAGLAKAHGVDVAPALAKEAKVVSGDQSALLVLEATPGRRAAMPLREISRLEEFAISSIERSGNTEVVQYRDGILPLVRLAPAIGLRDTAEARDLISVIVHEVGDKRIGIVIDRVLDVIETEIVRSDVGRRPGVLGSAVVQEHVTDLVDLDAVVAMAGVGA